MTEPNRPNPSRTVGKYALIRELGRGGMGVVYEATDTQIQRKVALKLMLPRPGQKPDQAEQERQRFAREAQMAAKLKHPGIVTLYEAGEIQGRRYLAMELIQGRAFSDWLAAKGLGLRAKVPVLRDIALAVHHAHEQGVLHRDLKPQNILVDAQNKPVVMDFGLAKAMGGDTGLSLTGDGLVVGTPAYMSPEQARGAKTVDGRTDVYSLGVMLYEMLAGRKPFEGETAIEILMKASKERPSLPSSTRITALDPALDRTIENICLKAMEKNPGDRYATARAFALDLDRWLKGEAVAISTVRRRVGVSRKTNPWVWISAAAGLALVVILGLALRPSPPPPSADAELARARRLLKEKKYTDARIEFGKALAKDPSSAEAREGDRQAQAAEAEAARAARTKEAADLKLQLEASRASSAKEIELAEQKIKTAAASASEQDQKRLREELAALKEKARLSEEEARQTREKLLAIEARGEPAPAPAPKPAPVPVPAPVPAPAPAPPPKPLPAQKVLPAARDPKVAASLLKEAVDAAVDRLDVAAIFKAADELAAEAGLDAVAVKADALKRAKKQVKARDDAQQLAGAHLRLAEDALAADDVKVAQQAARDASAIAKQSGDAGIVEEAAALGKELTAIQPEVERYLKAKRTLSAQPDEPGACLDAGRHLCLVKDRWEDGLPLLAKGSDEAQRKLALQEAALPPDAAGRRQLAGAWWASAQKERVKAFKNGALLRALYWYELALPGLRGAEKLEAEQRIDACYRQAPTAKLRAVFVPEKSMRPFPVGQRQGMFPEQKTDDATGPFRGEAVYFDQKSGTDVVYEIRSGRRLSKLRWKGAAMQQMGIEIQDTAGTVVAKGGPYPGGNVWAEFTLEFPPLSRFTLKLSNHVSVWYLVDTIELK